MKEYRNYINLSTEKDLLNSLLGKVCLGTKKNGQKFVSRFIKIDADELFFATKDGRIIMNRRQNIISLREYVFHDEEAV